MAIKGKRNSASFFAKARQIRNFVNGNIGYFLFRDNIPTICLAQWPMEATLWDGDLIAGPVPTLFTEEVEAGTKAILEVKIVKCNIRN
jgi:hypothetical protein